MTVVTPAEPSERPYVLTAEQKTPSCSKYSTQIGNIRPKAARTRGLLQVNSTSVRACKTSTVLAKQHAYTCAARAAKVRNTTGPQNKNPCQSTCGFEPAPDDRDRASERRSAARGPSSSPAEAETNQTSQRCSKSEIPFCRFDI